VATRSGDGSGRRVAADAVCIQIALMRGDLSSCHVFCGGSC